MAYSKFKEYRARDLAQAIVSMKIFEDDEQGLHHVILRLPAGMDIVPDVWRFERQGNAEKQFNKVCAQLETKGFECVKTGSI